MAQLPFSPGVSDKGGFSYQGKREAHRHRGRDCDTAQSRGEEVAAGDCRDIGVDLSRVQKR